MCKKTSEKNQRGTRRLCDIMTGYGSWCNPEPLGQKSSNVAWTRRGHSLATVVQQSIYAPNVLLFFFLNRAVIVPATVYVLSSMKLNAKDLHTVHVGLKFIMTIEYHMFVRMPHPHLESEVLMIMLHPPNSPNLLPCDY